jgi:hypothetical protein
LIVTEPGLSGEPATMDFLEYQFQYDLTPYPKAGKQIDKGSYKLILTVNRSSSEQ